MGFARWVTLLAAALIGIAYLVVGLVPLLTHGLDLEPVEVSIEAFERGEAADAEYLRVTGGAVVFSEADMFLRKTPDENGRRLFSITAPVVSPAVLGGWKEALKRGDPIDASGMRLAVQFRAEQAEERWPGFVQLAEAGTLEKLPTVGLDVIGETGPLRFLLASPVKSPTIPGSLDPDRVRGMRFEKYASSLGNTLMKLFWAFVWLAIAFGLFVSFRRRPPRPALTGPEVEMAAQAGEDLLDTDAGDLGLN